MSLVAVIALSVMGACAGDVITPLSSARGAATPIEVATSAAGDAMPAVPVTPTATATAVPVIASAVPTPREVQPVPARWASPPRLRPDAAAPPATAAAAAVLFDEGSAMVLHDWNASVPLAPASLTKIASAVVAIERGDLDRSVQVDVDSRVMRGSTVMGLIPGDVFTVRDLLYGMMLPSGNDASLALGRAVSGSDAAFVAEMNALAQRLGLRETRFANAHGLNAPGHLTSARDLAMLSRYAMSLPEFGAVVTTTSWTARGSRTIAMGNAINDVLYSVAGADGVKSGYTRQAGRTLVASAMRDGRRLYAVVLNDQQRLTDATALLNWGFASFDWDSAHEVSRQHEDG